MDVLDKEKTGRNLRLTKRLWKVQVDEMGADFLRLF